MHINTNTHPNTSTNTHILLHLGKRVKELIPISYSALWAPTLQLRIHIYTYTQLLAHSENKKKQYNYDVGSWRIDNLIISRRRSWRRRRWRVRAEEALLEGEREQQEEREEEESGGSQDLCWVKGTGELQSPKALWQQWSLESSLCWGRLDCRARWHHLSKG